MRFVRYKQVCRLNFLGSDDELKNVGSSFYKSQENTIHYNGQVNTKLLRFRLDSKMKNIKLKNPKLVLESVTFKDLYHGIMHLIHGLVINFIIVILLHYA